MLESRYHRLILVQRERIIWLISVPVECGRLKSQNKALDTHARQAVSERAGHSREAISSVYIGSKKV